MHRAVALVAALLVGGCGSAGGAVRAPTLTPPATVAPTPAAAKSSLEPAAVSRMSAVAQGSADSLQIPASGHDAGFLHDAFNSAESVWNHEFAQAGLNYHYAKIAFFRDTVRTACGEQTRDVGPFYCPADYGVYLNTGFFDSLARAFGLRSGFAAGYITGHEVGHHVQYLMGTLTRVGKADESDPGGENARSVMVELQADCYAGVWLHAVSAAGQLTQADVEDILRAAAVVGDDFQRNQAGAELAPETWTHGSSAQRQHWLSVGLTSGRPADCDTFSG